ncbi:Protein of unknown function [Pyronema omphalodes CBS 100304]|uniref:Uncharacterized protein n=1 Tax=Pyronema omphalodes (strain CBS 100304) TaxID=1076935 RepID=U4KXQ0_PYROM|nr:Protein of unknown function [Pyronema omphalodes CBS 100304]
MTNTSPQLPLRSKDASVDLLGQAVCTLYSSFHQACGPCTEHLTRASPY